jgi:D-alanine-D-alanine ligase
MGLKMTKTITVALLFGGRSAEHEVSLTSARAVYAHLDRGRFHPQCIYINPQGRWRAVESPDLEQKDLAQGEFFSFLPWAGQTTDQMEADIYFPVLHGPFGEDGTIQGLFEMAGVPYVGATVLASAAGMDKAVAKTLFQSRDLPVGRFEVVYKNDWLQNQNSILKGLQERFGLPLFVKPANLGSSVGISKVKDHSDTAQAVETAMQYDRKILVEEGILGREIECSVLGNEKPRASLPGEVIPHREFYDYEDKYLEGRTRFGIPADLSDTQTHEIQSIAVEAFRAIEGSGMARVDFFLEHHSRRLVLNEINTIPGFTSISMYPKLWEVSGLPFAALLVELIRLGLDHFARRSKESRSR